MKNLLLFVALALSINVFGQSKKDQIITLNNSIDSLNTVLSTTRDNSAKDISSLNNEINQLKNDVSSLESSTTKLTKDNEKFKLDLAELSQKNLALEAKLKAIEEEGAYLITNQGIGEVKLGMTLEEVRTFSTVNIESYFDEEAGEDKENIECLLKDGHILLLVLTSSSPRKVSGISTESRYYRTSDGIKAGMSVKKLKTICPDFKGSDPGFEQRFYGFFIGNLPYTNMYMRIPHSSFYNNGLDGTTASGNEIYDLIVNEIGVGEPRNF